MKQLIACDGDLAVVRAEDGNFEHYQRISPCPLCATVHRLTANENEILKEIKKRHDDGSIAFSIKKLIELSEP